MCKISNKIANKQTQSTFIPAKPYPDLGEWRFRILQILAPHKGPVIVPDINEHLVLIRNQALEKHSIIHHRRLSEFRSYHNPESFLQLSDKQKKTDKIQTTSEIFPIYYTI